MKKLLFLGVMEEDECVIRGFNLMIMGILVYCKKNWMHEFVFGWRHSIRVFL